MEHIGRQRCAEHLLGIAPIAVGHDPGCERTAGIGRPTEDTKRHTQRLGQPLSQRAQSTALGVVERHITQHHQPLVGLAQCRDHAINVLAVIGRWGEAIKPIGQAHFLIVGHVLGNGGQHGDHALGCVNQSRRQVKMEVIRHGVQIHDLSTRLAPSGPHPVSQDRLVVADVAANQEDGIGTRPVCCGHVHASDTGQGVREVTDPQPVIDVVTPQGLGQARQ